MAFNKNQIEKILYKEKPIATLVSYNLDMSGGFYTYTAETSVGRVFFRIPESDRPENLQQDEPAQLLRRWLDIKE